MRLSNPIVWIFIAAISNALAAFFTLRDQDRQNAELRGWTTGGDSYVYLEPLRRGGRLAYFIRHTGTYPAYDVVIRVHDETDRVIEGPIPVGMVIAGSGLDWLAVANTLVFPDPPPAGAAAHHFRVELQARNGTTVQHLAVRPEQGQWRSESRDVKSPPGRAPLPAFKEAHEQRVNDEGKR